MPKVRKLRLVKETVAELATDELTQVIGATDDLCATGLCNPCVFTWSCDKLTIKTNC